VRTTSLVRSAEVGVVLSAIRDAASPADMSAETILTRPPMQLREVHQLVEQACAAVAAASHHVMPAGSAPYWTDAALHALAGTPAVVYGPVGEGLHEDVEWVSTAGLRACVAALTGLARTWCAPR
jgi:acetylornithine deacetylase/succinyl-diaminopimelate desuccinylase-like protein